MKKKRSHAVTYAAFALSLVLSLAVAAMISCGGNTTSSTNPTTGTVNTYLSDPPTCTMDFEHVYVTITKVEANLNSNAGPNDSGWQTLVDLSGNPQQVDLLSLNPTASPGFCGTLYLLGKTALSPGTYQQIRMILMPNNGTVSGNKCDAGVNCVVPTSTNPNPPSYELQLSSQAQTGIKIPASQIANGGLTVTAGQSTDFNIDFKTCESIVRQGNGQYRFKPVLHAGEVSTNTNSITGKVVEGAGSPNPGMGIPNAIVLLEQPDTSTTPPTDRVILSGLTAQDGSFAFCPIASNVSGSFDVVVAGTTTEGSTTTVYNPSVVFGVPVGGSTASIPLFAETASGGGGTGPAEIGGQITTQGTGSTPIAGDVQLTALQTVTSGSNTVNLTIPVLDKSSTPSGDVTDSQPPVYTTDATTTGGCATTSLDCVTYSLTLPASAVAVGTWDSTNGNNVTAPSSTNSASYTLEGLADGSTPTTQNNTLLTCTSSPAISDPITVAPGDSVDQTTSGTGFSTLVLGLTGCSVPTP